MTKTEAYENAIYVSPHCMECQQPTERNEILFDGEKWEVWCYCPTCKVETFLPIPKKKYCVSLKNIQGSATFTGKPSKELYEAVNRMAEIAYQKIKK